MTDKQKYYPELNGKCDFPKMEEEVLKTWDDSHIFEAVKDARKNGDEFVFYDGPPFANGQPHYGHIFVSYVKDTIARFQTMLGKKVERPYGWDCHGLPAEMNAEKALGVSGHKAIEEYGVEKFNNFCKESVLKYSGEFVSLFHRLGRWIDPALEYRTMDLPFMESVIQNFKALYDKGLIYQDYRVQPYSWAAQTVLSNFEVNQPGCYRDKVDTAITVMFKLENGMHLLVWTTTPWTLFSNQMIAVGADIDYAVMEEDGEKYVLAEGLKGKYAKQLEHATQVATMKGSELVGMSYEPMFPHFAHLKEKGCFKILAGDFVSTEDGTGMVHIAPGFGADDFAVCRAYDPHFPIVCPVDEAGCFTAEVPEVQGKQVFDANEYVMNYLKENRLLVKKEQITHTYPHCWRTDTPLIYKAMSGWFVDVPKFRDELCRLNQTITWTPEHIKDGRFGKWLDGAREWSISRTRYWGAPIPVWQSDNPKYPRTDVFGSVAEIEEKTGCKVTDLHRPAIDQVVYPNPDDPTGQSMMRRVPDVFDCWFESGSAPEGQIHYPFEKKEWFEAHFPADFIVEGIDQTRGWFYSLHVLGTALHHKPAFKHCMVTGHIMAEGGVKMSKKLGNYPDPYIILNQSGSDAMRWFLLSAAIVHGGNVCMDYDGKDVAKAMRKAVLPFWNAYYFFCLYANAEGVKANLTTSATDVLDRYILGKLKVLTNNVKAEMLAYDMPAASENLADFLDILNNWYIRRSRERFWDGTDQAAFDTLYTVLVTLAKIMAPLMPFLTDTVYRGLTGEKSVHLADWPNVDALADETKLIEQMDFVRAISSTAKAIREENHLRNRLPLAKMTIAGEQANTLTDFVELLKDEVNVKEVVFNTDVTAVADKFLYLKTPLIGKRLGPAMGAIMAASKQNQWAVNPDGTLAIAGQTLNADEFELRLNMKEGFKGQPLPDNTAVVQLDVTVLPELEREGVARDFVRMVQQLRKDKGLDVSDRISLTWSSESALVKEAFKEHATYIAEQVLATSFTEGAGTDKTEELGDGQVSFAIQKA
ncbi:MAG: isoleucine--tRNA ligase [Alphaproteobacteria bacterium]|nr:isoleucine--tRNA ligase [Alphaproteobacteria bacterium]